MSYSYAKCLLFAIHVVSVSFLQPRPISAFELGLARRTASPEQLMPQAAPDLYVKYQVRDNGPACALADPDDQDWDQGDDGDPGDASSITALAPTPTSSSGPPAVSCEYMGPEPPEHPDAVCVCQSSITLPLSSVAGMVPESSSCDYKTLPPATATVTGNQPPPPTTSNCMVCQAYAVNGDDCSTVQGCMPTGVPKTNVILSKNPTHIGDLPSTDMYSQIMKLLGPACPDPTGRNATCDPNGKSIDPVLYLPKDGGTTEDATITFTIEDSIYDTKDQRDAMLGAVAQAFTSAATGNNCKTEQVDYCQGGQSEPNNPNDVSAPGPKCFKSMSFCDTANLVSVTIMDGGQDVAYMHVESAFKIDGIDNPFDCALIVAIVGTTLEVVAPELSAETWSTLGDIQACCDGDTC